MKNKNFFKVLFPNKYIIKSKEEDINVILSIYNFKTHFNNDLEFKEYVENIISLKLFKSVEDFKLLSKLISLEVVTLKTILLNKQIKDMEAFKKFIESQKYPNIESDKIIIVQWNDFQKKIFEKEFK